MSGPEPGEAPLPRGRGLALIGYRGTGKSTIGRLVARRTALKFVDADRELEHRAQRKIPAIFAEHGEPFFRDLESKTILDLTTRSDLILATGGGAILRPENREALRRFGLVVWLVASVETLGQRLMRDGKAGQARPALTSAGTLEEIADVLAFRLPFYESTADLQIDTEQGPVGRVVDQVTRAWTDWRAARPLSPVIPHSQGEPR